MIDDRLEAPHRPRVPRLLSGWQKARRWLGGRRVVLAISPRSDVVPVTDGFRVVGTTPELRLVSADNDLPEGWVSFDGDWAPFTPCILLTETANENEPPRPFLLRTVPLVAHLPRGVAGFRLRPQGERAHFGAGSVAIRALSAPAVARELVRPYVARLKHDPALLWHFAHRTLGSLRHDGWRALLQRLSAGAPHSIEADYDDWVERNDTLTADDEAAIRRHIDRLSHHSVLALFVAVDGSSPDRLDRSIRSVRQQLYPHWQLWLVPTPTCSADCREMIRRHCDADVRVRSLPERAAPSAALNAALAASTASYGARLEIGTELAPHALYMLAVTISEHPDTVMIYADEDRLTAQGERRAPSFKSNWDPELLHGTPYIGSFVPYRIDWLRRVGGWASELADGADWDLALHAAGEIGIRVRHIPFVLSHRRERYAQSASTAEASAAPRVLTRFARRLRLDADVVPTGDGHRLRYLLPDPAPLVSIIVPTRDHLECLRPCIERLVQLTTYPRYEIVIVDNDSQNAAMRDYLESLATGGVARVLSFPQPFNFPAIINAGVAEARGTVLALLNDDVEVIEPEWLTEMTSHALRPLVGAVGAKLYYPDGSIQHAGMVLRLGGLAGHAYRGLIETDESPDPYLTHVREVVAVSAACLVMRADVYRRVGSLDADNLGVSFNDVDLCLRLRQHGYRIVWTPHARLYHHESATRGRHPTAAMARRFRLEERIMQRRWGATLTTDPFCNPNLALADPLLPPARTPRVVKPWKA